MVLDHQLNEAFTVDEDDAGKNLLRILASSLGEGTGRDEDASGCAETMQRPNECLGGLTPDRVAFGVALGLHIDLVQTESVLVNDAVNSPITGPADSTSALIGAAITHGKKHIDNSFFEKVWVRLSKSSQQRGFNFVACATPAFFELFNRVRGRGWRFFGCHCRLCDGRCFVVALKQLVTFAESLHTCGVFGQPLRSGCSNAVLGPSRTFKEVGFGHVGERPTKTIVSSGLARLQSVHPCFIRQFQQVIDLPPQFLTSHCLTWFTVCKHLKNGLDEVRPDGHELIGVGHGFLRSRRWAYWAKGYRAEHNPRLGRCPAVACFTPVIARGIH